MVLFTEMKLVKMIYFKYAEKAKNLEQLLEIGFTAAYGMFQPTYEDKEFTKTQCKSARRSFNDLLRIAKTYFPKTTQKELATILVNKYASFYCAGMQLVIFLKEYKPGFCLRMGDDYTQDFVDKNNLTYNKIVKKSLRNGRKINNERWDDR